MGTYETMFKVGQRIKRPYALSTLCKQNNPSQQHDNTRLAKADNCRLTSPGDLKFGLAQYWEKRLEFFLEKNETGNDVRFNGEATNFHVLSVPQKGLEIHQVVSGHLHFHRMPHHVNTNTDVKRLTLRAYIGGRTKLLNNAPAVVPTASALTVFRSLYKAVGVTLAAASH